MEISREDESAIELPILALRGVTLFPGGLIPLTVARPASVRAVEAAGEHGEIAVVTQRDQTVDSPDVGDLHGVGTAASVLRVTRASKEGDARIVFVEGRRRVRLVAATQRSPYLAGRVQDLVEPKPEMSAELGARMRNVRELFFEAAKGTPNLPDEVMSLVAKIDEPGALADFVAQSLPSLSMEARQALLETLEPEARLQRLTEELVRAAEEQRLGEKIRDEVKEKISGRQREMLLREQMQAIRKELGEEEEGGDIAELRGRIDEAPLPEEARKQAERELRRLEGIPAMSPEYTVARNYLEWLASLPWEAKAAGEVELEAARAILDEDHYGLERVKERILEYLAVFQLKPDIKAPILCLVGPPGVGKTSVGRSIARAMGRKFIRASLGGVHDEAELRGHRRTYIGAMPGQIIQSLWRVGVMDPVFMLDEVDKLGRDFRGDPAAALLEILDPEQNYAFRDNYLDVAFDLSRVVFATTANYLDPIPPALLDRMEVLELPGYVDDEKLEIAKRYLVPKQVRESGLEPERDVAFTDAGLRAIITGYTYEAGVRLLEQKIAAVCRKRAKHILERGRGPAEVTPGVAGALLGAPRYRVETEIEERTRNPGVAVALAWTAAGGDILFVEASRMPRDRGELSITGSVRPVMEESVKAALSWLRASASRYGIDPGTFRDYDIHVHVPAGAVPKDGPSAGVVMAIALASLFLERPVRPRLGLTGEITLSGLVLPVGGIKEKVVAAARSGIGDVIVPERNRPDVDEEIPAHLREAIHFHFVRDLHDALLLSFGDELAALGEEAAGWTAGNGRDDSGEPRPAS